MDYFVAVLPSEALIVLGVLAGLAVLSLASRCMTAGATGTTRARPKSFMTPFAGAIAGCVLIAVHFACLACCTIIALAARITRFHKEEAAGNRATEPGVRTRRMPAHIA